jgi:FkbM family methyltransferase
MLKPFVKRVLGPKNWHKLKSVLGRVLLEEVEIIYDVLKDYKSSKVMIDVGAHFGNSLEPFAEEGWDVFGFEPDPKNREMLLDLCTKYHNVSVDKRAVSDKNQKNLSFFTSDVSTGISSLSAFHESHKESASVDTVTLEVFAGDNSIQEVAFLKIDTEGHDLFVLKGINWESMRPDVILCEFEDRKTKPLGYDFHDLAKYLQDKGYDLMVSEWYPMVEYGRQHKWRQFSSYPCELQDQKAWGNIIAVKDDVLKSNLEPIAKEYAKRFG